MAAKPTSTADAAMTSKGIHEEMLKDEVRTISYRNSIWHNQHLFKDKVVLDVGCGTGILCMFAAKAGAKRVIGVDMSNIIDQAKVIVKANGFNEDKILLVKGKMEEVVLPVDKVDIIISEWMGYALLYESMGGLIFPDKATMYLATIEDGEYKDSKINFWDNVYGFDMSHIKSLALREPLVDTVNANAVNSTVCGFRDIDLYTVTVEGIGISKSPLNYLPQETTMFTAFICYFDCYFTACHKVVKLPTGPQDTYTHWKQGEEITGTFSLSPNKSNNRDLDISISYKCHGQLTNIEATHDYKMC
ncbi:S-adenosyl-L-methionine-dependent methyltransferase [Obelidium mucronatum]|nr:S-adenosyl-L-methionine-dependent methyltransferase [Obelidium mucronatum]